MKSNFKYKKTGWMISIQTLIKKFEHEEFTSLISIGSGNLFILSHWARTILCSEKAALSR